MFTFSTSLRRVAVAVGFGMTLAVGVSSPAFAQQAPRIPCGDGEEMLRHVAKNYGEFRVVRGVTSEGRYIPNGSLVEISTNADGTKISVFATSATTKTTCIVLSNAADTKWEPLSKAGLDRALVSASASDEATEGMVEYASVHVKTLTLPGRPNATMKIMVDADRDWKIFLILDPTQFQMQGVVMFIPPQMILFAQGMAWEAFATPKLPPAIDESEEVPKGAES